MTAKEFLRHTQKDLASMVRATRESINKELRILISFP